MVVSVFVTKRRYYVAQSLYEAFLLSFLALSVILLMVGYPPFY